MAIILQLEIDQKSIHNWRPVKIWRELKEIQVVQIW